MWSLALPKRPSVVGREIGVEVARGGRAVRLAVIAWANRTHLCRCPITISMACPRGSQLQNVFPALCRSIKQTF
jgi:hypothetical protein